MEVRKGIDSDKITQTNRVCILPNFPRQFADNFSAVSYLFSIASFYFTPTPFTAITLLALANFFSTTPHFELFVHEEMLLSPRPGFSKDRACPNTGRGPFSVVRDWNSGNCRPVYQWPAYNLCVLIFFCAHTQQNI